MIEPHDEYCHQPSECGFTEKCDPQIGCTIDAQIGCPEGQVCIGETCVVVEAEDP